MQVVYVILIILCIVSIVLNFLIQVSISASLYLLILEISICAMIVIEISMRIYLQGIKIWCSLGNIIDLFITILCVFGLVLSLQRDLLEKLGNTTCDALLILRNIIFLFRLIIIFKRSDDSKVTTLKISLNSEDMRFDKKDRIDGNEMVVRDSFDKKTLEKFRPPMDVLFEEEDEEGSYKKSSMWKGQRVSK
ncbi:hypothetical protein SteCoe_1928 [Stentor coeruleus]|uniref:Ion transport domain-containing protein n=1 Tax=Stentor coeruleus TaxID=5963 RepID=A0A1R2D0F6_9CILI|nr:hypothetical protein SteCoe_1928 [Stentor coeruleus]